MVFSNRTEQNRCLAYVVVAADLAEEPSGVSVCVSALG